MKLSIARFLVLITMLSQLAFADQASSKILTTVPDVKQTTDYTCGVSSLVAVLAYYGKKATEKELMVETNIDPESGVALGEIVKSAERRGVKAVSVENAQIKDLENAVVNGQLAIVLLQAWRMKVGWFRKTTPWEEEWDSGHYLALIGFDEENLYFEDPWLYGNRGYISKEEFVKRWHGPSDSDVPTQRQAVFFQGIPNLSRRSVRLEAIRIE